MILSDIRDYLQQRNQASLSDIALHVGADEQAVQGMLAVLVRRGEVRENLSSGACQSSCQQCDGATNLIYTWGKSVAVVAFPSTDVSRTVTD